MRDTFTSTAADAGRFDHRFNAAASSDAPSMADLMDEGNPFARMTPCPRRCGSHFHGESVAYRLHMESGCADPWS